MLPRSCQRGLVPDADLVDHQVLRQALFEHRWHLFTVLLELLPQGPRILSVLGRLTLVLVGQRQES